MRNSWWWLLWAGTACATPAVDGQPSDAAALFEPAATRSHPAGESPALSPAPRPNATAAQVRVIDYRETTYELGAAAWLPQLSATVDFRSAGQQVRLDFDDVTRDLDFGGRLRFELSKFDWSIMAEGSWVRMSGDGQTTSGNVRTDYENATAELALTKSIEEQLKLFVGARYQYVDVEAGVGTPSPLSDTQQWVEPFVGGTLFVDALDWLDVSLRGDVGGFGAGSDLTWNVIGMLYFRPADFMTIDVGYRVLDVNYERSDYEYRGQLHGALIGVAFYW